VHHEPAALDSHHPRAVLSRAALVLVDERPVVLLDVDAAVLPGSTVLVISMRRRAAFSGSA